MGEERCGARRTGGSGVLEREPELAATGELLDGATAGEGGVALVEGPPGIGKTALMRLAAARAGELGMQVLTARGGELERGFSYGVARQLFEPAVLATPAEERAQLLAGAASLASAVVGGGEQPDDPVADPSAIPHGIYWLTANLAARKPLLLSIDDLHWCDPASMQSLLYLSRRVDGLPVAILLAARALEPGVDQHSIDALRSEATTRIIKPRALSAAGVHALATHALGAEVDDAFTDACLDATRGNPFYLTELLRDLRAGGAVGRASDAPAIMELTPGTVAAATLTRIARMAPEVHRVAHAVAILEPNSELRLVAELARLDDRGAAAAADALWEIGILESVAPCRFAHPILRRALEDDLRPAQRAQAHVAAARALERVGAPTGTVAAHLLAGSQTGSEWTVTTLRRAARQALSNGSSGDAIAYLSRAANEPPEQAHRPEVLLELGRAQLAAYSPDAAATFEAALELADGPRARAGAALELGRALLLRGALHDAVSVLDHAAEELGDGDPDLALGLALEAINAARFDLEMRAQLPPRLEHARALSDGTGLAHARLMSNLSLESLYPPEPREVAISLAIEALSGGELVELERLDSPVRYLPTWTLIYADAYGQAATFIALLTGDAQARGSAPAFSIAVTQRAVLNLRQGELVEAEADALAALDSQPGTGLTRPLTLGALVETLIERGRPDEARAVLTAEGLDGELPNFPLFTPLLDSRGKLKALAGDPEGAVADWMLGRELGAQWGAYNPSFTPTGWRSQAAIVLDQLGRREQALSLAQEGVELAQRFGAPRALAIAVRSQGLVLGSIELLEQSVGLLSESPARLERARSLIEYGAALRRGKRRAEARAPLEQGLELAHRCGATPLVARGRDELAPLGVRPRSLVLSGADSLTASEARVAKMAAGGMSNRDIAQALFVTLKTVEKHLRNSYGKLGIDSRRGLREALVTLRSG